MDIMIDILMKKHFLNIFGSEYRVCPIGYVMLDK